MKVVRLQAENIKRLIAVDITPDGAVVQITGKNGQGKSSVLDSIWYALGGERNIPGEPVRKGEKKASVTLDLGDLIVTRRWTESGTSLVVTNNEGLRYSSPQKVLDTLCGRLTFDPLAFARLKPSEQAMALSTLVGLDLSDLEQATAAAYYERRDINRDIVRLEAECTNLPTEAPPAVDTEAAERAVTVAREAERAAASYTMKLGAARADHVKAIEAVAACERAIVEARARLHTAQESEKALAASLAALEETAPAAPAQTVEEAMAAARAANEGVAQQARWQAAQQKLAQLQEAVEASKALTAKLGDLATQSAKRIAACKFPLAGLVIQNGIVRYNDVPFDQCSSAEQLRVSTAIAMQMNPKLRVLRIADGSLLDSDSMQMLKDLAAEQDYQVWIETVDSHDATAVVIDDGHVVLASEAAA